MRFDLALRAAATASLVSVLVAQGLPPSDPRDPSSRVAPFRFVDAAAQRGIGPYYWDGPGYGAGLSAADYDDDGDIDLFIPNETGYAHQLYRNDGGYFTEIAAASGIGPSKNDRNALWLDYDGDGRLDLLLGGDCFKFTCAGRNSLTLYRHNADHTFTEVTAAAGLSGHFNSQTKSHMGGLCAGDLNNDGFLDIFVANWRDPAKLFINNTDGTFTDVSVAAGVALNTTTWQPMIWDVDGDGWQDIYVATDFVANLLWLNQGNGTFVESAASCGLDNVMNDMGMSVADYDNDGDLDVYTTNIYHPSAGSWNALFRNDSTASALAFSEVGFEAGCHKAGWGWGCTMFDADADGWLDIAATNGFTRDPWLTDASKLFWSRGALAQPVTFDDVSDIVGYNDTYYGAGVVALDFDRDGDLDLAQTCYDGGPVLLLENRPVSGQPRRSNWLSILPRQSGPNRFAVGAVITADFGGLSSQRVITCGTSFLSQEPFEAYFGLGMARQADRVEIRWPDGATTVLTEIGVNQVLTIERP